MPEWLSSSAFANLVSVISNIILVILAVVSSRESLKFTEKVIKVLCKVIIGAMATTIGVFTLKHGDAIFANNLNLENAIKDFLLWHISLAILLGSIISLKSADILNFTKSTAHAIFFFNTMSVIFRLIAKN